MKKLQIRKLLAAAFLAILPLANVAGANAAEPVETPWGPERKTFTWDNGMDREIMGGLQQFAQLGMAAIIMDGL